jgi:hypothetical protein
MKTSDPGDGGGIKTSEPGDGGGMNTPFTVAARKATALVRTVRAKPQTRTNLFIDPSEREIRSRRVYLRFRAIQRKYFLVVCPKGTHTPPLVKARAVFLNCPRAK